MLSSLLIFVCVHTAKATQIYDDVICPHILSVHTYKTPTFCNHCGVVMFGILKQGLKCEGNSFHSFIFHFSFNSKSS